MLDVDLSNRPRAEELHQVFTSQRFVVSNQPLMVPSQGSAPRIPKKPMVCSSSTYAASLPQHSTHILVLEHSGPNGMQLVQYWRKDSLPIYFGHVVSTRATSSASVALNMFSRPNQLSNLDTLVLGDQELIHYICDCSNNSWHRKSVVSAQANGPPSIIHSTYTDENRTRHMLETAVLEGNDLVHYCHQHDMDWYKGSVITNVATGPGCLIQSTFGGNLEVVVLEGLHLIHYWRNNDPSEFGWNRGPDIMNTSYNGPSTFIQTSFISKPGYTGDFKLVILAQNRLVHFCRDHSSGNHPWRKRPPITLAGVAKGTGFDYTKYERDS